MGKRTSQVSSMVFVLKPRFSGCSSSEAENSCSNQYLILLLQQDDNANNIDAPFACTLYVCMCMHNLLNSKNGFRDLVERNKMKSH